MYSVYIYIYIYIFTLVTTLSFRWNSCFSCLAFIPLIPLREHLASLSACVLLDCTGDVFVWPVSQMGSHFPSCLLAFPCPSPRWQFLHTGRRRAARWTWRRAPCSAADTAVPPWELSPMWGLQLPSPSVHQLRARAWPMRTSWSFLFPTPFLAEEQKFVWWWPPSTQSCTLGVVLFF